MRLKAYTFGGNVMYGKINRQTGSAGWVDMGGHAVRIDGGPNGDAYTVTADGSIWYGNGTVWITYLHGGIGRWNATTSTWERTGGRAVQISVGPDGVPWVVQGNDTIWYGTVEE
jgi:hypothetical protein